MMASYCIPHSTCNTEMVGWVSGAHPTAAYELVTRTACMHYTSGCCQTNYPVEIRNCSGFYVYKLQPTGSNQRYCGVNAVTVCDSRQEKFLAVLPLVYHSSVPVPRALKYLL
ncbi:hypothetical protein OS493_021733 [Desmophyllum pertusum]|uniref:UMOD/GP2/OIT3-like D8C domain-containing protein n=1 Tax=Desmophyllum pertusum TaxID=174260 RepID=A0A9W9YB36_9CNID|nr:hypothetical protein OS493_021733 [Desmophyllum pertusum]